jgi:flagellar hook-associated protein FlgK
MILQRSYSANSQSLKAIDQVLRDTLQMVGWFIFNTLKHKLA